MTRRPPFSRFRLLASLLSLLLALSCGGRAPVHLVILSTNDVHGALEASHRSSERPVGGEAMFATAVGRIRAEAPGRVILVDAGDIFQGTALSNLLRGRPMTAVMNRLAYDAAEIGNHEFDWGVAVLRERIDEAAFPVLGANVREREGGRRPAWLRPYAVVERAGVRVAVIGITTEDTPETTLPSNVADLVFTPAAAEAQAWIDRLVPDSADVAVILAHIGGRGGGDGEADGPVIDLAREIHGEAAVLGGHTHGLFAVKVDGVPVAMAGSKLRAFARIDLDVDVRKHRVTAAEATVVPVNGDMGGPDSSVAALIDGYKEELEPILARVLGRAAEPIERSRRESPMGSLLCDAAREGLGLDIVLHNPGGVRAPLPAGDITYAMVYEVMPFDNTVVVLPLTGRAIDEVLTQAASTVGFLHASGLSYTIDSRGDGPVVRDLRDGAGRPIDAERTYRVGINSFMAEGGDGLTLLHEVPGALDTGVPTRDLLTRYVEEKAAGGEEIVPPPTGRITIVD